MNYEQYKALVDKDQPDLNIYLMPVTSPPEIIKIVAVELFRTEVSDSELALETRLQLNHLKAHGRTDFEITEEQVKADKALYGKARFDESEFV